MFGPSKHLPVGASAGMPDYIRNMNKQPTLQAPKGRGMFGRFADILMGGEYGDEQMGWVERLGRGAQGMNQYRDEMAQQKMKDAAASGDMTALGRIDPFAAAKLKLQMDQGRLGDQRWKQTQAWNRQDRADDLKHRDRVFDAGRADRAGDVAHRDRSFDHSVSQDAIRNNQWQASHERGIFEGDRAHDMATDQFGHRKKIDFANLGIANEKLEIDRAEAIADAQESIYSAGEIKSMREKGEQLTAFQNSLDTYLKEIETQGVQAFDVGGRNQKAARLDAQRQDLLFQGKNLWELGVLSKDDYENMEKAIPDATGIGVAIGGKGVALQKAQPLKDSITYQLNRLPEEYRSYIPQAPQSEFPNAPQVGTVDNGYEYRGGNPADPNSWERVS